MKSYKKYVFFSIYFLGEKPDHKSWARARPGPGILTLGSNGARPGPRLESVPHLFFMVSNSTGKQTKASEVSILRFKIHLLVI